MSVPTEAIARVITVATRLESQGFFEIVRTGDQKAASLFARLVAWDLNPSGDEEDFGCLSKSPGETQVDGFAEDAIIYGSDPANRENVLDLVNGAGAPDAKVANPPGVKPRREHNRWVKPQPLTTSQLLYLRPSGKPPEPPAPPKPVLPGREEMMNAGRWLDAFYRAPDGLQRPNGLLINGGPDWEGVGAWLFDVYLQARISGKTEGEARAAVIAAIQQTDEWKGKH